MAIPPEWRNGGERSGPLSFPDRKEGERQLRGTKQKADLGKGISLLSCPLVSVPLSLVGVPFSLQHQDI